MGDNVLEGVFFGRRGVKEGATKNSQRVLEDLKQAKNKGEPKARKPLPNKQAVLLLFGLGTLLLLLFSTVLGIAFMLAGGVVLAMGLAGFEIKLD